MHEQNEPEALEAVTDSPRRNGFQSTNNPLPGVAIFAIAIGCLAGGMYWLTHRGSSDVIPTTPTEQRANTETKPDEQVLIEAAAVVAAIPDESDSEFAQPMTEEQVAAEVAPKSDTTKTAVAPKFVPEVSLKDNFSTLKITINGPLESAIVAQAGKSGTALTQVVGRALVWWLRVPQDVLKGDELSVVYETRDGKEPVVHAVKYESRKFSKSFEAWRYKAKGDSFARFYQLDGTELEERLVTSPIVEWEQVTSLLRDGRKHKGVDYKAPVGTKVRATFDGVITRKNWNFKGNGNSIEIQESGGQGRTAMYLHLSELPKSLVVGQKIKKGQEFASSGNSGHSFAPHLHFQLMNGDKVLDPFESMKTTRASLSASELPKLEGAVAALKKRFPLESWAQR